MCIYVWCGVVTVSEGAGVNNMNRVTEVYSRGSLCVDDSPPRPAPLLLYGKFVKLLGL